MTKVNKVNKVNTKSSDYDNMIRIGLEKPDLITFKRLSDEMEGWSHVD